MKFRPCIDIHNGKVKQIVGASLKDQNEGCVKENFVATCDAAYYAGLYKEYKLTGGHIILLNNRTQDSYEATKAQALQALHAYPGGLQIGGGVNDGNARDFIEAGATHVIVTSFVFQNGRISFENLRKMTDAVGKEHLVLDLSCKKKNDGYYIVTDRWQKDTDTKIDFETLNILKNYCDEFLIHAVDVEGKMQGIEEELTTLLGRWGRIPITYAGGVHTMEDLKLLEKMGNGRLDVTIGSALDLFGGTLSFEKIAKQYK